MADMNKLRAKEAELLAELSDWATSSGALSTGEQLVFTLGFRQVPTVVAEGQEDFFGMPVRTFFSEERIRQVGKDPRIYHAKIWNSWGFLGLGCDNPRLFDVLRNERFRAALRDIRRCYWKDIGPKTIEVIKAVLDHNGIKY
ncbi:MAG: hypothetical protein ABL899_00705 [Nitrospira sp.]